MTIQMMKISSAESYYIENPNPAAEFGMDANYTSIFERLWRG
ncbi:hypothetical protein [Neobacillus sp. NPDC093127]